MFGSRTEYDQGHPGRTRNATGEVWVEGGWGYHRGPGFEGMTCYWGDLGRGRTTTTGDARVGFVGLQPKWSGSRTDNIRGSPCRRRGVVGGTLVENGVGSA